MKVIILLGLFLTGCAHDTVKVPKDCDVLQGATQQTLIVSCPHRINLKH